MRVPSPARSIRPDASLPAATALGVVVGLVAGLGAWAFRLMIGFVHNLAFAGRLDVVYDANQHTAPSPWGVLVVLVPVVGAVVVVYLVENFAPEARGHGVPEVMDALYYRAGVIRPVVAGVKALASAVSIGTGGSVGREGPIVQIGSAFGSTIGQLRRLSANDTRLLIAAGSAAGIAATFNAPIGGVLFAVELLLVAVSARALLVVGVAVAAGVSVARSLLGSDLAFTVLGIENLQPITVAWGDLLALAALGAGIGLISAGFIRGLYRTEDLFGSRFHNPYLRHVVGMGLVGLIMLAFFLRHDIYAVEGVGYAAIFDILSGVISDPWLLMALLVGKALATFLTLGSGASGGVFSPALFLGATAGAAIGYVLAAWNLPIDPVLFAVAGMAGMVAGVTGAVMTAVVMVAEMTGDFGAAVPFLLVAVIAVTVRRTISATSIYTEKLTRRGQWVPSGLQAAGVDSIRARDVMRPVEEPRTLSAPTVEADASVFEVMDALQGNSTAIVIDGGAPVGVVSEDVVREALGALNGGQAAVRPKPGGRGET